MGHEVIDNAETDRWFRVWQRLASPLAQRLYLHDLQCALPALLAAIVRKVPVARSEKSMQVVAEA